MHALLSYGRKKDAEEIRTVILKYQKAFMMKSKEGSKNMVGPTLQANERYKTFGGYGHWFEMDRRHMRIRYGWSNNQELNEGLLCIKKAISKAMFV